MQLPVLYSRFWFIHSIHNSLHLLVPSSRSNSPSHLFSWQPQSVLYVYDSISQISVIFQIPCINDIIQYLSLSFSLTLLNKIISKFIHVAENGKISSFLWLVPLYICTTSSLYIHLLFLCLGYHKQCCCEHRGACIFLNYSFYRYMYIIMSSENRYNFTSFPILKAFISVSCLIALAETFNTILNRSDKHF